MDHQLSNLVEWFELLGEGELRQFSLPLIETQSETFLKHHITSTLYLMKRGAILWVRSASSEEAVVLESLDLVVVSAERLIHVVGVGDILSVLNLIGLSVALGEDLLAGHLIALHHLNGENVVDLDVVRRDAVVQEVRGEHHVVALVPELRVVLVVELEHVPRSDESEARDDQEGEPEPHEKS